MGIEERRKRKKNLRFDEKGIKLALAILDKLEKPLELLYYLMKRERDRTFVIMLLSADEMELENLIKAEKRDSDLLFEIDKENNLYALICQETKIDGGYRFAERFHRALEHKKIKNSYSVEIEVGSPRHEIKEVIFKLIETYMKAVNDEREGEIIYHSLQ
ncbi:hypothetical protein [Sulfurovum sp.]|uniref:hypothetical protein n=1 Tax=Sulfurovum sp. TaxID=1969726 RepID=UPI0025CB8422|nr:hypothetical protein [Sulfurovum sp.]